MALPGITPAILGQAVEAMNAGYTKCFKIVYLATLGFGIPGIIAACFVQDVSQHFTSHTAVDIQDRRPLERGDDAVERK